MESGQLREPRAGWGRDPPGEGRLPPSPAKTAARRRRSLLGTEKAPFLRCGFSSEFFGTLTYHSKSHPADEKSSLKGAWSGSVDPF